MATGVLISSFQYVGVPSLSAIFGFFKTSSGAQIQRIQISAQTPPTGGNLTVQLVDQSGNAYGGAQIILPSGTPYYDQPLAAPITLGINAVVRAQIVGVDGGVAQDLTVNIIGATAQGTTSPSGCGPSDCQPPQAQLLFFAGSVQPQVAEAQAAAAAAQSAELGARDAQAQAEAARVLAQTAQTAAETAASASATSATSAASQAANSANSATASANSASASAASASSSNAFMLSAQAAAAEAQSGIKAATLQLTPGSTQTIPDATPTAIQWNNAMFDDLVFFNPVNPTRLTIPASQGIQRIRVSAGVRWDANTTGNRSLKIRANPVGMYTANTIVASCERPTGATGDIQAISAILTVEAGMYFEVIVEQDSTAPLDIDASSAAENVANFFTIEVLKRTTP